ncbi:MAG: hypothetical protein QM753_03475 [Thermomicrobiales bacterium]
MGYFILVIAQTVVLPIACGSIELIVTGGNPVEVFGKWWVFWGVGPRLLVAGFIQVSGKGLTSKILGAAAPTAQEKQITHELGTANLSMGVAGLLAFVPEWALPVGIAGGLYLLMAGLLHVVKKNKGPKEIVATWTDLIVVAAVAILAIYTISG